MMLLLPTGSTISGSIHYSIVTTTCLDYTPLLKQESPADAGKPARRKNDEKNSSISKL